MKIPHFIYSASLPVTAIMILSGCVNLYKLEAFEKSPDIHTIESLKSSGKVFIIHSKDTAYQLTNFSIKEDTIGGVLFPVSQIQAKYLHPKSKMKNVYDKKDENEVLNEAHIYVPIAAFSDTAANLSIPVSNISKINIYEKNEQATKRSHVAGYIVLVGTLLGGLIVLIGTAGNMTFGGNWWGNG